MGGSKYDEVQPQVDEILRRFFMARIGLRFLLQQQIESFNERDGYSGSLELECNPAHWAQEAANASMKVCKAQLGQSPRIVLQEEQPGTFTFMPKIIFHMLYEIFKNSCRA